MSTDLKLGNDFLHVPRLLADGKGFVVWKERLELSIRTQEPYTHLDGSATKLLEPPKAEGATTLTEEQVSAVNRYTKEIEQYLQE